jgi:Cu-Zn family superoxide dismutase
MAIDKREVVMNKVLPVLVAATFALGAGTALAASATITVNAIDATGIGTKIGIIKLADTKGGLKLLPNLRGLPPGAHGFHIHVNPNCGPSAGSNGQMAAGMAAGGHLDPMSTGKHMGPMSVEGHEGDLPVLVVDAKGKARKPVLAPRLTVAEVTGHAIMIHAGGDNYSDQPAPLGGGGMRIACGVVQ